ncbi:hypothetical protein ACFYW8_25120 [Streptomyces sp. NPDC002742]|uniref:hypothetical protein n=1 Tax=Streptomyces sp. NPDC002742 TaxID=3364663 RepID=UPI0036CD7E02
MPCSRRGRPGRACRGLHTVADVTYLDIGDTESLATEVLDTVNRLASRATETGAASPTS